ncbi:MAG: FAD binding domain-containing protein [Fuerstiella sp.]|nr:FAD binding domain-containing protein [Fuerstiella sp.]
MRNFEYAQPTTEHEAVTLLTDFRKESAILAGGTDLVGLMKRMVVAPDRVVNVCEIDSLKRIEQDDTGKLWIGAAVRLNEFSDNQLTVHFPSVSQVIQGISSIQLQSQGTFVGELLRRPTCWYFREGHGLLADNGQMVVDGDNRYHAILGNHSSAKFVNASRLAPPLIALGAQVRIIGPGPNEEQILDLQNLYRIPMSDHERENVLQPGQLVTHVILPPHGNRLSAAYEVRHGEGPDQPLAAAAVSMEVTSGMVRNASIVLGQVAPAPWIATGAAQSLCGKSITEESAEHAGIMSVTDATPLSQNEYKVQLAQVAVRRAVLKAAGHETGGADRPMLNEPSASPALETNIT